MDSFSPCEETQCDDLMGTATVAVMSRGRNTPVIGTGLATVKLAIFLEGLALFHFTATTAASAFYLCHICPPPFKKNPEAQSKLLSKENIMSPNIFVKK